MIAAAKALPAVGGVLDEQKSRIFAKQLCEGSRHDKSSCLLGYDIQSAASFHSYTSRYWRAKIWAQSRILLVRDKIDSLRLYRSQRYIACNVDTGLTCAYGGDVL